MLAEFGESDDAEILHASFSAEGLRCCVITRQALHILQLSSNRPTRCLHSIRDAGGFSSSCLLPGRSFVAFVTGSRRRCKIFNFESLEPVHTFSESEDIMTVLSTDSYLVLVMRNQIHIHAFSFEFVVAATALHFSVSSVVRVNTSENLAVACAVASGPKVEVVAFPAPGGVGKVGLLRLPRRNGVDSFLSHPEVASPSAAATVEEEGTYSISLLEKDGYTPSLYPSLPFRVGDRTPIPSKDEALETLHQFDAHVGALQAMAVSFDGRRLATMSEQGTILRVWDLTSPTCELIKEVRRGSWAARVYSIAFSDNGSSGHEVACYGSSGTLHVFSAERSEGSHLFAERALSTFSLSKKGRRGVVRFVPTTRRTVVALLWSGTVDYVDLSPGKRTPSHKVIVLTPSAVLEIERSQQPGVLRQVATWVWEILKNDVFTEENIALGLQLASEHFLHKVDPEGEGSSKIRSGIVESFPPVVKLPPTPSAPDLPPARVVSQFPANVHEDEFENERIMCAICFMREKDTLLEPCRHVCCSECAETFREKSCPFCRRNVESTKRVFL